jgi:thiamine kinase-like enzyme
VNTVAATSPEWPHGTVVVRAATTIGAGYGLAGGVVYRVEADSEHGPISFVLKQEAAVAVESALRFHRVVGPHLEGTIPTLLGGAVDDRGDAGVLLLENIAPARQGDVLVPCTDAEALAVVRALARVHAVRPQADAEPRWQPRVLSPDEWAQRLGATAKRFPQIVTAAIRDGLRDVPDRAARAVAALGAGPVSWVHGDAHLDNVLFRPDGTAVLLDWSGPVVGPPAVDLTRMLTEGFDAGAREELAVALVDAYARELTGRGVALDADELWPALAAALALLVQTAVGWAAREVEREPVDRLRALQESLLRRTLAWASNERARLVSGA